MSSVGVGDSVRCYHCGGGLRNWEPGDDPMKEHAKWYPSCQHVIITKGKTYIHSVEACENPEQKSARRRHASITCLCKKEDKPSSLDDSGSEQQQQQQATQAAAKFGYSEENIKIAAYKFRERYGASSKFKESDLVSILMEKEDDPDLALNANVFESCAPNTPSDDTEVEVDDLQSLMLENERLKDLLNCKICLDRRANIVYLPCGHIFSCPQCSRALDRCPICRSAINGLVKAKFSNTKHEVAFDYDDAL
ncbi:BIRC8-like protein [Mya arenaria]|uniref:BIRC8-like protein n=1 Tax=Mya arenaria TaxID=6604 RepID=A0ABY7EGX4_MYAAR|nr:baculoviral IAP repeat-containing protein 7-A-like [Mya arenaria]WAR08056.1 BIRC8-like protein [Mya arenaria]